MGFEELSIFNMDTEEFVAEKASSFSSLYKPSIDKEKKDDYTAVLKFLPWHEDYKKSYLEKYMIWLVNPDTDEKKYVDCPSSKSINKPSILRDLYYALGNSSNAMEKQLADKFGRVTANFSLVQIIEDKNHPELEGKIMVFQYGKFILDLIKSLMKPTTDLEVKNNPFDVFDGFLFILKINKVGGFTNYKDSKFIPKTKNLVINGKEMTKDKKNFEPILNYLKENSPNLLSYDAKEWDDDTIRFVHDAIHATLSPSPTVNSVLKKHNFGVLEATPDIHRQSTTPKITKPKVVEEVKQNTTISSYEEDDEFDKIITSSKPKTIELEDDFFNDI